MTHTDIQALVAKTAAFDGAGVSISGITGDWTLVLEVYNLTAGATVRFVFEDSVDAFSSDVAAGPSFSVTGQVGDGSGVLPAAGTGYSPDIIRFSIKKKDFPDFRAGTASATTRLSLTRINGSSPSVVYHGWLES
jgi:hypothetical protein